MGATNPMGAMGPGSSALVMIVVELVCILLAWWAVQSVRFELFLRDARSPQGRVLQILIAVVLGSGFAQFLVSYLGWSVLLKWLV